MYYKVVEFSQHKKFETSLVFRPSSSDSIKSFLTWIRILHKIETRQTKFLSENKTKNNTFIYYILKFIMLILKENKKSLRFEILLHTLYAGYR